MGWHRDDIVSFNFLFYDPEVNFTYIFFTCQLALTETELLFSTTDKEIWRKHLVLGKSKQINTAQLIVKDRQTVIWANAVLPFFLALARHENEPKLEKLLYQLFMILPAEDSSSKTRFMENSLWFSELSKSAKLKMNTFGNRQGLIQI